MLSAFAYPLWYSKKFDVNIPGIDEVISDTDTGELIDPIIFHPSLTSKVSVSLSFPSSDRDCEAVNLIHERSPLHLQRIGKMSFPSVSGCCGLVEGDNRCVSLNGERILTPLLLCGGDGIENPLPSDAEAGVTPS